MNKKFYLEYRGKLPHLVPHVGSDKFPARDIGSRKIVILDKEGQRNHILHSYPQMHPVDELSDTERDALQKVLDSAEARKAEVATTEKKEQLIFKASRSRREAESAIAVVKAAQEGLVKKKAVADDLAGAARVADKEREEFLVSLTPKAKKALTPKAKKAK